MRKALLFALSLLGLFDASYLWWAYTSPSHPMVCLGTGCDVVRASSYAQVAGVPLPAYGAAMYAALALAIFAQTLVVGGLERGLRWATAALAAAGFLASLYLTGVEAFVLHAWCAWCVVSALAMTAILVLALVSIFGPPAHFEPAQALATARSQFAILLAALAIGAPSFYLLSRGGQPPPPQPASLQALTERLVRPTSHVAGNPQAALTVVEFADFECPYCGRAEKAAREMRNKFGHQIRFVFRHFPQAHLHPHAEKAAEASECAATQGKFWEAAEKFYEGQNDLSEAALERYARELGLDSNRFHQCLSSGEMAASVEQDLADARALGFRGPPTFVIGQNIIEGPLEPAQFSRLIEQELTKRGLALAQSQEPPRTSLPGRPSQASPASRPPKHAADPATHASNPFGGGSVGIFGQYQRSGMVCSEEEAKKLQPTLIRTPEARQFFEGNAKALFVDVRAPRDFAGGRIRGALNVPVEEIGQRWSQLPRDRSIVLYESGKSAGDVCASSRSAGRELLAHGFEPEHVKVYQDGLAAWEKEGLPVER